MATPWTDMESAFWTWMTGDAGYAALGLKEYKGHLGEFFPHREINTADAISTAILPAIETRPIPGGEFGDAGPRGRAIVGQIVPVSTIALRIMHRTTRGAASRGAMDSAIDLILRRINGASAHRTSGALAGTVGKIELATQSLEEREVDGRPIYWIWTCPIRLEGTPTQV